MTFTQVNWVNSYKINRLYLVRISQIPIRAKIKGTAGAQEQEALVLQDSQNLELVVKLEIVVVVTQVIPWQVVSPGKQVQLKTH